MERTPACIGIHSSEDFGESCRRIRYINRMSQERLAFDVGVSTSTIQRIENGKMAPSINLVCRIAEQNGMDVYMVKKGKVQLIENAEHHYSSNKD